MCLLHADLEPDHEVRVAAELRARGLDVCASHEVSPEMREYERTVTTVVNAALRPVCRPYLRDAGRRRRPDGGDDVRRWPARRRAGCGAARDAAALGSRRRRAGRGRGGACLWPPRRVELRHGWDQHRRLPDRRRRPRGHRRARGGGLPGAPALGRHPHHRRRWRQHRPHRRGWRARGGSGIGRRRSRSGRVRARWCRPDGDRRQRRARSHPRRLHVRRG